MASKTHQTISGTSKPDFYMENIEIGHFQVTKPRDFSNFLKIIHKLTSFLTSCSVGRMPSKTLQKSQVPQNRFST